MTTYTVSVCGLVSFDDTESCHVCMKVLEPIADEQLAMNAATAVILQDTLACLACKVHCFCTFDCLQLLINYFSCCIVDTQYTNIHHVNNLDNVYLNANVQ